MISAVEILWENHSLASWQATQNQPEPESDPDSDISALVPACARLLAWLTQPETCERRGMRVTAMAEVIRPDLNGGRSLGQMSGTSKQNLSKLMTDFRSTFNIRPSAHQIAKGGKV